LKKVNIKIFIIGFSLFRIVIAQNSQLGTWSILNLKYQLTNKISFFGESQLRSLKFYDHFHYYEYKAAINYLVNKSFHATLGAGSYQTYAEGGNFVVPKNNDEFRLWPQFLFFQDFGNLKLEHRYRYELRWTSSGFRNRYRMRIGISYPFCKYRGNRKLFAITANNELFFTNQAAYFERNRMQLVFNYKPTQAMGVQIGFVHQFDYKINDETGRESFLIGFTFELIRKKKVDKKELPNESID
jgi:hypothetical protein